MSPASMDSNHSPSPSGNQPAARESDRMRQAQEAAYNFMVAMAGNNQGFEEASRALFAGNIDHFRQCIGNWPADIRDHLFSLASAIDTVSGGAS